MSKRGKAAGRPAHIIIYRGNSPAGLYSILSGTPETGMTVADMSGVRYLPPDYFTANKFKIINKSEA